MRLEVRNLVKNYKIKNHEPVKALNNVSLLFPETGLVFILGKSGSGKSTLLNVMGGLDKADSGEIIINNKSSKDFSGSEMDSYRNTYLGFIFQEYNILSDFTIGENIGLALELQHKKATTEAIDKILDEVDLSGMNKRKPNELSGGQKQRVAIARALVKDPKIIFADEPTGALDSATGQAVFETLKKLSQTRLVVCVSHDREFAEHFGDRVIELKDGEVISDITKTSVKSEKPTEGLALVGDNIIRIEKGHKLSKTDIDLINKALEGSNNESYISFDPRVNESIKQSGKIDKDGNREEFYATKQDEVKAGEGQFEVIKSKFGFGPAFRMGAKSLKIKPFRLFMTILLSFTAFAMFGFAASCARIDKKTVISSSLIDSNCKGLVCTSYGNNGITIANLDDYKEKFGDDITLAYCSDVIFSKGTINNQYYLPLSNYGAVYNEKILSNQGYSITYGKAPSETNEILISDWAYMTMKEFGLVYYVGNECCTMNPEDVSEESVIGKVVDARRSFKICGIYSTNIEEILKPYSQVKGKANIEYYYGDDESDYSVSRKASREAYLYNSYFYFTTLDTALTQVEGGNFRNLYISYENVNQLKKVVENLNDGDGMFYNSVQTFGVVNNASYSVANEIIGLLKVLKDVFLGLGIGFMVFSMLLFYNFISISINNKRNEIGILRAVGARGVDVFKIFYSESFIIAMINFVLATIATIIACVSVNNGVTNQLGFRLNILNPGIVEIGLVLLAALFASFIASLLPVTKIARQKPIDAIRKK